MKPEPDYTTPNQDVRLVIGHIAAPHGIRGEFRMHVATQFPERLPKVKYVYLGQETEPRTVKRLRLKGNIAITRLEGINSREEVDELRTTPIYVDLDQSAPIESDAYYYYQLIGLQVVDEDGVEMGRLTEIIETGANDVYVVRDENGKDTLIPALFDVIPEIDITAGRMVVRRLEYYENS